ncbi:hypothetical protein TDB9533_03171 [Thalassocella blandensis]|nr:hypothetical protein TDB9533_03171 [Thalassocella blandensis]
MKIFSLILVTLLSLSFAVTSTAKGEIEVNEVDPVVVTTYIPKSVQRSFDAFWNSLDPTESIALQRKLKEISRFCSVEEGELQILEQNYPELFKLAADLGLKGIKCKGKAVILPDGTVVCTGTLTM